MPARRFEKKSRDLSAKSFVVVLGNCLVEVGGTLLAGGALVGTGSPLQFRVLPIRAIQLGKLDVQKCHFLVTFEDSESSIEVNWTGQKLFNRLDQQ